MDDYLTGELVAEVRHEYFGGRVFPMPGASDDHNRIAGNLFLALGNYLEGHVCEVFSNDMKARTHSQVFYYPDVMVGCDPRDTDNLYLRFPKLLIEVLSEATERLDRREKRWSYQTIESLEEYVLVAQDRVEFTVFRRANEWQPEVLTQLDQLARFVSLDFSMPLSSIYEGVRRPA